MMEQVDNILAELKLIQAKLPELRDLFWLKIDRYSEIEQQRGIIFDEKFELQRNRLSRAFDSFSVFIEKSFTPSAEEKAKEKALQKLCVEFPNFNEWNEEAKKALLEREVADCIVKTLKKTPKKLQKPNRGPKYQINNHPDKVYSIDNDFSHCRPCSFEFRGQKYVINNWAMLLKDLAEILYNENSTPIDEFIPKDLSKKPLFSKNPETYLRALEITKGLFVESNFSANQMCVSCKKMLDIYGFSHSEIKVYLDRIPAKL